MVAEEETAAVPDELRCHRNDGRGWRCKNLKVDGRVYCSHHLVLFQKNNRSHEQEEKKKKKKKKKGHEQEEKRKKKRRKDPDLVKPNYPPVAESEEKRLETQKIVQAYLNNLKGLALSVDSLKGSNVQFKVGGTEKISFWNDWWCGEGTLKEEFPMLFDLSQNKSGSIQSHICMEGEKISWDLGFRRYLYDWEMDRVASLMDRIGEPPSLGDNESLRFWTLDPNDKISLRPFFYFQRDSVVDDRPSQVALDPAEEPASRKRELMGHDKVKSLAIQHALKVQANIDRGFPSFLKSVHSKNISGKFWLGLPSLFCNAYLPTENVMIDLIDENEEKYRVQYFVRKMKLTVGWEKFSIAHKLVEGDVLVFQMVRPTEFQVYIVRAYPTPEAGGITDLQYINSLAQEVESCKRIKTSEETKERHRKTSPFTYLELPDRGKCRSGSLEVGSEGLQGVTFLATAPEFKDIKSLESFTIVVNGMIIDSELTEQARIHYYELCCSQKAFLHGNIRKSINCKLAAGLISQTIIIAGDIRTSKLSTSLDDFAEWDSNLEAFEQLGMNVAFLRARTQKLVSLVHEMVEGLDSKRCEEAIVRRDDVKEEIRTLKVKLNGLKEAYKRVDTEIEILELKGETYELKFQTEVDAPWRLLRC